MKYKGNHCKVCDGDDFFALCRGPHTGAYCSNCGRWLKWLSVKDAECFKKAKAVKLVTSSVYGTTAVEKEEL